MHNNKEMLLLPVIIIMILNVIDFNDENVSGIRIVISRNDHNGAKDDDDGSYENTDVQKWR